MKVTFMLAWKDDKDRRKGKAHVGGRKWEKQRMIIIINREMCCAIHETQAFSREFSHVASVTQLCQLAQQFTETPKLLKGHRNGLWGTDRWQPKSPTTASGRRNQPAGSNPKSNHSCSGPRHFKRDGYRGKEFGETSSLDIGPGQGPVSTKTQSTLG